LVTTQLGVVVVTIVDQRSQATSQKNQP